MAKLLYTKKYPAYRKGDRTEKKIFEFGDNEGVEIRAVRKYQNDSNELQFKTVEIKEKHYKFLIETINSYHNEFLECSEMLDKTRDKLRHKNLLIENLREQVAIAEEN
jgi:hypothetical protein